MRAILIRRRLDTYSSGGELFDANLLLPVRQHRLQLSKVFGCHQQAADVNYCCCCNFRKRKRGNCPCGKLKGTRILSSSLSSWMACTWRLGSKACITRDLSFFFRGMDPPKREMGTNEELLGFWVPNKALNCGTCTDSSPLLEEETRGANRNPPKFPSFDVQSSQLLMNTRV